MASLQRQLADGERLACTHQRVLCRVGGQNAPGASGSVPLHHTPAVDRATTAAAGPLAFSTSADQAINTKAVDGGPADVSTRNVCGSNAGSAGSPGSAAAAADVQSPLPLAERRGRERCLPPNGFI